MRRREAESQANAVSESAESNAVVPIRKPFCLTGAPISTKYDCVVQKTNTNNVTPPPLSSKRARAGPLPRTSAKLSRSTPM